jgi:hypothetical protein
MRLWSVARFDLRLTDAQFFELSPRQFHALTLRRKAEIDHAELLAGIVAACVVNHSMSPPKTPARPIDFMPSGYKRRKSKAKTKRWPSAKRFALETRATFTAFMAAQQGINNVEPPPDR